MVKGATGVGKSVAVAVVASSPAASPADPAPAPPDLKAPERLPNVEEELKVLSAAIAALRQPGLSRAGIRCSGRCASTKIVNRK